MAQHSFAQPRAQSCTTWARRPRRDGGHVGVLLWVCRAVRPRCGTGTTKHDITPTILGGGQAPPRCSRTMPKATKAGRQMARFDEGELWCADDAVPPVSPAGWYFRPGGTRSQWLRPDGKGKRCYPGRMSPESSTYTLAVVVEPAEEAWHAYCPTLLDYGAATWGVTREEALEHISEVVAMVVEHLAAEQISFLTTPADLAPASAEEVVVTVHVPSSGK